MRKTASDYETAARLDSAGIDIPVDDARTLRRASMTLHRWGERECGDGSGSWIERDETTGKPFVCYDPGQGAVRRYPTADREAGALRRIQTTCERLGLHFFHQTDPRGAALYVSREPMTDCNYSSRGVAVY